MVRVFIFNLRPQPALLTYNYAYSATHWSLRYGKGELVIPKADNCDYIYMYILKEQ